MGELAEQISQYLRKRFNDIEPLRKLKRSKCNWRHRGRPRLDEGDTIQP